MLWLDFAMRRDQLAWRRKATWLAAGALLLQTASCKQVWFRDTRGFASVMEPHGIAAIQWCMDKGHNLGMGCRNIDVLHVSNLAGGVFVLSAGDLTMWAPTLAEPKAGQAQFETIADLVRMAQDQNVSLLGNASERVIELLHLAPEETDSRYDPVISARQSFPVNLPYEAPQIQRSTTSSTTLTHTLLPFEKMLLTASQQVSELVYIKVAGSFSYVNLDNICVEIVETPQDCNSCAFLSPCRSEVVSSSRLTEFIGFQLPNPALGRSATVAKSDNHTVCMLVPEFHHVPFRLGTVTYHPTPNAYFLEEAQLVNVRTFLNPGWGTHIEVTCSNCSSHNRLVVRSVTVDKRCTNWKAQDRAILTSAFRDSLVARFSGGTSPTVMEDWLQTPPAFCTPPERSPCEGYIDEYGSGMLENEANTDVVQQGGVALFGLNSSRRLSANEKKAYFRHHSALCFYLNEAQPNGTLLGFAALRMDGHDLQGFVAFVCFFGVVLPLICMITALLHLNKQDRCKQYLQEIRLLLQREQLEREMSGATTVGDPAQSSSGPRALEAGGHAAVGTQRTGREYSLATPLMR